MTKGVQDRMVEVARVRDAFRSAISRHSHRTLWDQTALPRSFASAQRTWPPDSPG